MMWFKKKDDELIKLLKNSATDFEFDPNTVKYRLLTSLDRAKQSAPVAHSYGFRIFKYAAIPVLGILFICSTFAFASSSRPGDTFFALNKFGEKVILTLPLNPEQKAKVEEHIVTSRLEALDQVKVEVDSKKLETVKESDESLTSAITEISANKKTLEAAGNQKSAEKLGAVLDRLQIMAQKRDATIQALEDETSNESVKSQIRKHRLQIRANGKKSESETKDPEDRRNRD